MKKLILIISLIGISNSVAGQMKIGLNTSVEFPLGYAYELYSNGYGGQLSFGGFVSKRWFLSLETGATHFKGEGRLNFGSDVVTHQAENVLLVPMQLGFKYHFRPSKSFDIYSGFSTGIVSAIVSTDYGKYSNVSFSFYPIFGANYNLSDDLAIDFNVLYGGIFTSDNQFDETSFLNSFIGVNVGVVYTIHSTYHK